MYYLESDEPNSPGFTSNKKKQLHPHYQRCFPRRIVKLTLLLGAAFLLILFGCDYIWPSPHGVFDLDPRDQSIVQYFCNQTSRRDVFDDGLPKHRAAEHHLAHHLKPKHIPDEHIPDEVWKDLPTRGALYMVVRNEKLQDARAAMRSIEDRFNAEARYPWVLLNNQAFSDEFRKYISKLTKAPIYFGKIDAEAWNYPDWIDVPKSEHILNELGNAPRVQQGGSLSFHQMLRYQSGLYFHHPLMQKVEYAWRVEPGSSYSCDMGFDPFRYMKENNKKLAFTITMREAPETIQHLWPATTQFMESNPDIVLPMNETIRPWILDSEGNYNMCHFWSNFEIVDLAFLRSEAYQRFFAFLDRSGGFFYERWGDAPVRTMAAAMFLKRHEVHFFNQIGYTHSVATHCPFDEEYLKQCSCDVMNNYDVHPGSCTLSLLRHIDRDAIYSMADYARNRLNMTDDKIALRLF